MTKLAVLDYDAGNVRSAQRGFERAGAHVRITDDPREAGAADGLVIPGVGHFATCAARLRESGLHALVAEWIAADRPVFGICVGMQLLYGHSEEGDTPGLGLLPGEVRRLPLGAVVPHMGWDVVRARAGGDGDALLDAVAGERVYFVHGYYAQPDDPDHVIAECDYAGVAFPCLVREGNVVGTQFHPEKSGDVGARLLANWVAGLAS